MLASLKEEVLNQLSRISRWPIGQPKEIADAVAFLASRKWVYHRCKSGYKWRSIYVDHNPLSCIN